MLPGITLVISPLISLIKDQVMALRSAGVSDAYLNSSLTSEQIRTVYRQLRDGAYRIVYVAPERLAGDGFVSLMQKLDVSFVALDEAHCIYDNRQNTAGIWACSRRNCLPARVYWFERIPGFRRI